jgi:transposase InsO family protein
MTGGLSRTVLRPGDWVSFDSGEHQVLGFAGTSVRLRAQDGSEQVVLASYLMAAPDFAVTGGDPVPGIDPLGLLDGLPEEVLAAARDWERHVVEVESGVPPDAEPGTAPRPGYDSQTRTVAQRTQAKAEELGVTSRTVERMRARYADQGLWGLVDRRTSRARLATGRADARLVAVARQVIEAETHASTGTRGRLIRRVAKAVEDAYGPGVVPLPGRSTFYKLVDALTEGRHTFGSAVTRRQAANRPERPFTPTFAARPGEQVQIDSTPIDIMVILETGMTARADLTIAVDVASRTICAAVLRPVGTKAVDAALLLARMLVPEPMRPGRAEALRMSASRLPYARLLDIDARMEMAAAKPVIVPDTIVIDGGKVFMSDAFIRACARLGVSVQDSRPRTPTDKAIVEATFDALNTLFCQHVAGYTGSNTQLRGDRVADEAAWTVPDLQDLLDEWLLAGWARRPHDALRDPYFPRKVLSPNDKYAALVAAAGYLPVTLTGEDYLELLPVAWRAVNEYGIQIDYRTYDAPGLGPYRRQHSGNTARRGLYEVHYDPYDLTRVFVRTTDGWVTAPWTHLPMVSAPFADFTWRHARRLTAQAGRDDTSEAEVARVLDELLTRAQSGPTGDKVSARIAARTRVAAAAHRPPVPEDPPDDQAAEDEKEEQMAEVIPLGVFDARAVADRWPS